MDWKRTATWLAAFAASGVIAASLVAEEPNVQADKPIADVARRSELSGKSATELPSQLTDLDLPTIVVEQELTGLEALEYQIATLEQGCQRLATLPGYTATMVKQERHDGLLTAAQEIELKLRHEPFSVYMKWKTGDAGREVIYVEGENDGKLLVHAGGWKARFLPVMSVDPHGSIAMAESRHPITSAGLLRNAEKILKYRRADLQRGDGAKWSVRPNVESHGRLCDEFITVSESEEGHDYRKSIICVDRELGIPISIKNYTWAKDVKPELLDEQTLVESYAYRDLNFNVPLSSVDFDRSNKAYSFRSR